MIPIKAGNTIPVRLRWATLLAAAALLAAPRARAAEFRLFPDPPAGPREAVDFQRVAEPELHIVDVAHVYPWNAAPGMELATLAGTFDLQEAPPPAGDAQEPPPPSVTVPPPKLFTTSTTLVTAGALVGGFLQGLGAPLQYGWVAWNVTDEGWFGRDTYVGGADKISHFVISSGVSRALYEAYIAQGKTVDQSFNLALATSFMAGTFVEIMDGVSVYGFSFQDLTVDALGAAAGLLIQRNHLEDMLGLRLGLSNTPIPPEAVGSSVATLGRSYNDEIYAADFKPAGLVRRLGGKPGFERFFLTSFVFFTRGFGYDPPLPTRYQQIGFEVGLNFPEILRALGVDEKTWWGTGLQAIFQFFRFPFTQVGVYYNLYDNKWYGPGAPYSYY
jgi:uncharacterized protein YfiM (DUF2279 family)